MARRKLTGDVQWYFPKKKRQFHKGTVYAKECLTLINKLFFEQFGYFPKIKELRDLIEYEGEESHILDKLIEAGYGEEVYFNIYY